MRDSIIKLVKTALQANIGKSINLAETITDYLIENNVFKLPCSINDTVYVIESVPKTIRKCTIDEFCVMFDGVYAVLNGDSTILRRYKAVNIKDFGESVFLDKEDAKKKFIYTKEQ